MKIEDRITPKGFIVLAKEYYFSYLAVQEKFPSFVTQLHTKYFLICHSIELIMKAELRIRGVTARDLKSNLFGHNFDKLLTKLREFNILLDQESTILLRSINEYYRTKQFEYPLIGSKSLIRLEKLALLAQAWISKVDVDTTKRS